MSHVWVRHTILPIYVTGATLNPNEGEVWFEYSYNEDALEASIEEAAYGCDLCGVPLIPQTYSTRCEGVPNDLEKLLASAYDNVGSSGSRCYAPGCTRFVTRDIDRGLCIQCANEVDE